MGDRFRDLSEDFKDRVIRMAWEDRTTFDEIERKTGLSEAKVIELMRKSLKRSSFRMWRKRVSGRTTKHEGKFRQERRELKRSSGARYWMNESL